MKNMVALTVMAASLSVFAGTKEWFNENAETFTGDGWEPKAGVSIMGGKLSVSSVNGADVTYTPAALRTDTATITFADVCFTAEQDALPDATGAKAGITIFDGKFYVIADGAWIDSGKAADATANYTIYCDLDYAQGTVAYRSGAEVIYANAAIPAEKIGSIAFNGDTEMTGFSAMRAYNPVALVDGIERETFADALAAAVDGSVIKLIDSVALDAQVDISLDGELTLDLNGQTVSSSTDDYVLNLNKVDLTVTDSSEAKNGKIAKTSKTTMIQIGKQSAATLTLEAGEIAFEGENPDGAEGSVVVAIAGSFTMNGGKVNANGKVRQHALRTKASSGSIVVNGGVVIGDVQENLGSILVPATSTAMFSVDYSDYCEDGYETVKSGEFYVVQQKSDEPGVKVVPGEPVLVTAATEAEAIAKATVEVPAGVVNVDSYKAMFSAAATDKGDGVWSVTFELKPEIKAEVEAAAETAEAQILSKPGEKGEVEIDTKEGLFYSVATGTAPDKLAEGSRTMGDGKQLKLEVPAIDGAKGFYQIQVNGSEASVN